TRFSRDWSSDVCSSDLIGQDAGIGAAAVLPFRDTTIRAGHQTQAVADVHPLGGCPGGRAAGGVQLALTGGEGAGLTPGLPGGVRSEERRVGREWAARAP